MMSVYPWQKQLDSTGYLLIPPGEWKCPGLVANRAITVIGYGAKLFWTSGTAISNPNGFSITVLGLHTDGYDIGVSSHLGDVKDTSTTESLLRDCRFYNCNQYGIYWQGPSDGYIRDCVVGNGTPVAGIFLGPKAGNINVSGTHTWTGGRFGMVVATPGAILTDIQCEGAKEAQLCIAGHEVTVNGARLFDVNGGHLPDGSTGLQLGMVKGDPLYDDGYAAYCRLSNIQVGKYDNPSISVGPLVDGILDRQDTNVVDLWGPPRLAGKIAVVGYFRDEDKPNLKIDGKPHPFPTPF